MVDTVTTAVYRVKVEGKEAVDGLDAALDALAIAEDKVTVAQEKVTRATRTSEAGFDRLRARLDPAVRAHQQYQAAVEKVARYEADGIGTSQERARLIDLASKKYLDQTEAINRANRANAEFAKTSQASSFQTANLAAQFQDIAVQLQGGQNPFTIALQQGTQISQVLGQRGATGVVGLLGGAFASLLSPVSLATIGIIGLGGAALQFGLKTIGAVDDLDERIKRHTELVNSLKDAYGEAGKGIETSVKESQSVLRALLSISTDKLQKDFDKLARSAAAPGQRMAQFVDDFGRVIDAGVDKFAPFRGAIDDFNASVRKGNPDVQAFRDSVANIVNGSLSTEVRTAGGELLAASKSAGDLANNLQVSKRSAQELSDAVRGINNKEFADAIKTLGGTVSKNLTDREKIAQNYTSAMEKAKRDDQQIAAMAERDNQLAILSYNERKKAAEESARTAESAAKRFNSMIDQAGRQNAGLQGQIAGIGQGVRELARLEAQYRLTEAAQQAFGNVTPEIAAKIAKVADAAGRAKEELAFKSILDRANFDQMTIGLSNIDRQIAATMKTLYGPEWQSHMDDALAKQFRLTDAIKQMSDAQRQAFTSLISDLSSGRTGMEALANATTGLLKKFADIGANQVFNTLTGQPGGLNFSGTLSFDTKATQSAVQKGVTDGLDRYLLDSQAKASNSPSVGGISLGTGGGAIGAGLAGAGALAGAFFNGQKTMDTGTAAATGALSGALAGTAIMPGIGTVVGAIGGAILGWFGANDAKKKQHEADVEAWEKAKVAEQAFVASLNGKDAGTLTSALTQAKAQVDQYVAAAEKVEDYAAIDQLHAAFATAVTRQVAEFKTNFGGMIDALNSGLGMNSPIVQAQQNVKAIGDQLKAFVDDTDTASRESILAKFYGNPNSPQAAGADGVGSVVLAMRAAQDYALSLLQAVPVLSETQKAIQSIAGTADQLRSTLVDLGMSSLDAASRIDAGIKQAMDALADNFSKSLTARINAANDQSYLNDTVALLKQHQQDVADAASLGVDSALVAQVFQVEAQKIVDGAELIGDSFDVFILQFPELANVVHQSTTAMQAAADKQQQIADQQKKSLQDVAAYVTQIGKTIHDYLNGLKTGTSSTLSPQDQLSAAQSQFNQQFALAQAGDRAALGTLTQYSDTLLEAAKSFYGSSAGYAAVSDQVTAKLQSIPETLTVSQVTAADQIVAAIQASQAATVSKLQDGTLQTVAAQYAAAGQTVTALYDANGQIVGVTVSQTNALSAAANGTTATINSTSARSDQVTQAQSVLIQASNQLMSISNGFLNAIQGLQSDSKAQLALLNNQLTNAGASISMAGYVGTDDFSFYVTTSNNNLLTALNKIVTNTYAVAGNTYALVQNTTAKNMNHYLGVLASGGWIEGGIPGVDSVPLGSGQHLGMPGEFVVRYDVAQANKAWLPAFNETGRLPSFAMPAMPIMSAGPASNDNGELRAVLAELKALRETVAKMDTNNVRATVASAQHVREGVDEVRNAARDSAREAKLRKAG